MALPTDADIEAFISENKPLIGSFSSNSKMPNPDDFIRENIETLAKDPSYDELGAAVDAEDKVDPESKELAYQVFKHRYDKPEPFSMKKVGAAVGDAFKGIWGAAKGAGKLAQNVKELGTNYAIDAYQVGK